MTWSGFSKWARLSGAMLLLLGIVAISLATSELMAAPASAAKSASSRGASRLPTATEQARYYIPHVQEIINVNNTFCSTAIIVTVPFTSPGSVKIEVEVFGDAGGSIKLETVAFGSKAGARWTIITDSEIEEPFTLVDKDLDLTNFAGFAIVSASDPQVAPAAQGAPQHQALPRAAGGNPRISPGCAGRRTRLAKARLECEGSREGVDHG